MNMNNNNNNNNNNNKSETKAGMRKKGNPKEYILKTESNGFRTKSRAAQRRNNAEKLLYKLLAAGHDNGNCTNQFKKDTNSNDENKSNKRKCSDIQDGEATDMKSVCEKTIEPEIMALNNTGRGKRQKLNNNAKNKADQIIKLVSPPPTTTTYAYITYQSKKIKIKRKRKSGNLYILLDSGASHSIIKQKWVGLGKKIQCPPINFNTSKGLMQLTEKSRLQFILPEFSEHRAVTWDFFVDNTSTENGMKYDMILGRDFLSAFQIDMLFSENIIRWDGLQMDMRRPSQLTSREDDLSIMLNDKMESKVTKEATRRTMEILDDYGTEKMGIFHSQFLEEGNVLLVYKGWNLIDECVLK